MIKYYLVWNATTRPETVESFMDYESACKRAEFLAIKNIKDRFIVFCPSVQYVAEFRVSSEAF